jgi:hypothetical protein
MKAQLTALVLAAMVVVGLAATAAQAEGGPSNVKSAEAFGIIWEHGNGNENGNAGGNSKGRPQRNVNLLYHGGPVQTGTTKVFPIYWGSSWGSPGDKISGLDSFYSGVSGSAYAGTNTEYTNGAGQHVSSSVSFNGDSVDTTAAPSGAPSTTQILQEVARRYPSPTAGAYYPVYIDQPRGNTGYCAWHSSGTINGTQVQFGFFFNLDGDGGCDPQSTGPGSQGLKALANVSGHELSEMLTDPQLNAWYDQQGEENSDKCAWTWSGTVAIGGQSWKIQGNWSNAAATARTGYANVGCIQTS